ncbi:MAG: hypothetical protein M1814_001280 [Vezdaea aestivalis]|nr:MAG: hypothetical protein M1814_001280 [Vezdaea aestivalis]
MVGRSPATSINPSPSPAPSTKSTELSTAPPTASAVDKTPDDKSKLATFLSILRRFIGVTDIAAVRFSLPAQLLEPTPNLEYWGYLDRPESFIKIGDSDDPLERTLAVLRFWFTKDLCMWEVETKLPSSPLESKEGVESTKTEEPSQSQKTHISYLTEQTSHHPPVSAFYVDCPEKGISARGFDQLSAKFTGTSIRVTPGSHNLGIFITLHQRDNEEYQLTHPAASLGGIIRGNLSVSIFDLCYITCPKSKIKVILHYLEEGWLGKSQNRIEGVVFRFDPDKDNKTKIKDVQEGDILAKIEGSWKNRIYYTLAGSSDKLLLIDLDPLLPVAKLIPPEADQLPNESRRFWKDVTAAIIAKDYPTATQLKQQIEEKQREKAAERQAAQMDWQPRFFSGALTPVGRPDLTNGGREALKGMQEGKYSLKENAVTGA